MPTTLVITTQDNDEIGGVITYARPRGAVSIAGIGRLGTRAGRLALMLTADSTSSHDQFDFSGVEAGRLAGVARSFGRAARQGVIVLVRRPA